MNDTPQVVVVSSRLTDSPWPNAVVAGGDLAETIDDLDLFVNPTAIGQDLRVFPDDTYSRFELVSARGFDCGISTLQLAPGRS